MPVDLNSALGRQVVEAMAAHWWNDRHDMPDGLPFNAEVDQPAAREFLRNEMRLLLAAAFAVEAPCETCGAWRHRIACNTCGESWWDDGECACTCTGPPSASNNPNAAPAI